MLIRHGTDRERRQAFANAGVTLIEVAGAENRHRSGPGADSTGQRGGADACAGRRWRVDRCSLLRADLVDHVAWFHAPAVLGGDGWPAVQAFGVQLLDVMPRFTRIAETPLGDDMLTSSAGGPECSPASSPHSHGSRHHAAQRRRGHAAGDHRALVRYRRDPIGASIGCSGACLTAIEVGADWFRRGSLSRDPEQDHDGTLEGRDTVKPGTLALCRRRTGRGISYRAMSMASAKRFRPPRQAAPPAGFSASPQNSHAFIE